MCAFKTPVLGLIKFGKIFVCVHLKRRYWV